ncbi:MAG: hypothetical protein F6J89_07040 [Symploca sp. SIO1C4]|uniref:Uncharacterized protein n=1 Tax=Symploca sp. SIO1C4 TaxID=2607765 RepID=A0A6B3N739_9CYAN|nr:hypothetical protein [Symploca sp. SIO1C4]
MAWGTTQRRLPLSTRSRRIYQTTAAERMGRYQVLGEERGRPPSQGIQITRVRQESR